MNRFEVDPRGLKKLLERRGKEFIVFELIQNAWDQDVTTVNVSLTKEPGSRFAELVVEDNDPRGFDRLSDAWTLFAESGKKGDATKRGRFNLGEKLVLAVCDEAEIVTTTGGVRFDKDGRHRLRKTREYGSAFWGSLRLTNEEFAACCAAVERLIPPAGIITTFNGKPLELRTPIVETEASLATEIADADGNLRRTTRKAAVRIYKPLPGEVGTLFEMGIPVVETGDGFHADVGQKVPLNFDRDNVPPAYLRAVRTLTLNAVHHRLNHEDATSVWVRDALGSNDVSAAAVRSVVEERFGYKAVVYDPSDPEANKLAVAAGYTVVSGGQLSKSEWENVRAAGALRPAGQVTPSPKPFTPDGEPLRLVPEAEWSAAELNVVGKFKAIAQALINSPIRVEIADDPHWRFGGCFGRENGRLIVNRACNSPQFFDGVNEENLDFLIHELGHHYEGDHLSESYYRALTSLGARLAMAAAQDPGLFS